LVNNTKTISTLLITPHDRLKTYSKIVREFSIKIILNGQDLVTLLCSPGDPQYLAVGFIQSQGLIKSKDDIKKIIFDKPGFVRIETRESVNISPGSILTSSGGKSTNFIKIKKLDIDSQIKLSAALIFSLMEKFERRSRIFKETGGVHSAALCNIKGILVFKEDIGRHNAIDKVFGQCLLQDIATRECFVITSGRVSSEILYKVAQRNIPILVSKNAPTDLGVKLAKDLGITLVGFVRGMNMNVYTSDWRIVN
jgi:FdhD protein